MLQDIMANRLTEIDSLCGEIITRGESLGIPTPLNLMLLTLIKGIENSSIIE
jgi:2-dehydropantoate 2-reductase